MKTFEVRTTANDKQIANGLPYSDAMKLAQSYGYTQRGEPKAIIMQEA